MVLYFALNLLCAYVSCIKLRDNPSDPLSSVATRSARDQPDFYGRDLIVDTRNGGLEGYIMRTIRQRPIHAFEGIPFAEPPIRANRFEPPIPKGKWQGVRSAMAVRDFCPQWHMIHLHVYGNEDCLYLNVYTPKLPKNGGNPKLPVIVFIHGGCYFFGSGAEYGPAYLLEEDVILVTINYRLGILGFLSTGDKVVPGNNGLKDQVMALKWVHENIEFFGGDPSRVTIMGQSSGGASVHLHMISKSSREYFSGAISLSGTAFNPWSFAIHKNFTKEAVQRVSKATRCDSKNSYAFIKCLRRINAYQLTTKFTQLYQAPAFPPVPLPPVIEAEHPGAFLTKYPDQVYADGEVARVPWISGRTHDEGHVVWLLLKGFGIERVLRNYWNGLSPYWLNLKFATGNVTAMNDLINDFYFETRKVGRTKKPERLGDIFTDRMFAYATHKSLQAHSQFAPTYSHLFGYKGRHGIPELLGLDKDEFGVGHIEDLHYYFNMTRFFDGYKTTDPEFAIVKLLTNMFANFAKTREPLYTDENGKNIKIWDPVTDPRNISVLEILKEVKMIPEPNRERLKFWETVPLSDTNPLIPFD